MERRRFAALTMGFCLLSTVARADPRSVVFLDAEPAEVQSQLLIFQVKEAFRHSLVLDYSDNPTHTLMTVKIVTMDVPDLHGIIYTVIFLVSGVYITSVIGTCGNNTLPHCAQTILGATDHALGVYAKLISDRPAK